MLVRDRGLRITSLPQFLKQRINIVQFKTLGGDRHPREATESYRFVLHFFDIMNVNKQLQHTYTICHVISENAACLVHCQTFELRGNFTHGDCACYIRVYLLRLFSR